MLHFKNGEVYIIDRAAAAALEEDDLQEQAARFKRDNLIALTDHHALSDRTMSDEIRSYRQALRDAPEHENWPYLEEADWPTKPE